MKSCAEKEVREQVGSTKKQHLLAKPHLCENARDNFILSRDQRSTDISENILLHCIIVTVNHFWSLRNRFIHLRKCHGQLRTQNHVPIDDLLLYSIMGLADYRTGIVDVFMAPIIILLSEKTRRSDKIMT